MSSYQVSLDVFEGPLDLLLRLIEREELDIALVSLALVADQYLAHLAQLSERSASNLADFLVIAAKLLVIKSRNLLPKSEEEGDGEEEDWEDDLVQRLQEYKRFKLAAAKLREIEERGLRAYPHEAPPPRFEPRLSPGDATIEDLVSAFRRVLEEHPLTPPVDQVVAPVTVHIADCISTILTRLRRYGRVRFSTLMRRARSRAEMIVTFLAMLELIKQQRLRAVQERPFGEIHLQAHEPSTDEEIPPLDLSEYGESPS